MNESKKYNVVVTSEITEAYYERVRLGAYGLPQQTGISTTIAWDHRWK